jgi:hypothetical protein
MIAVIFCSNVTGGGAGGAGGALAQPDAASSANVIGIVVRNIVRFRSILGGISGGLPR